MPDTSDITLVYDGQCPVCDFYAKRVDVSQGNFVRIDAREESDLMNEITAAGLDIDKGMVLKIGDSIYFGADAARELALLSSGRGFFNTLAAGLFRFRHVAKLLYPVTVGCRNLLLKILGRSRINNLDVSNNDRF